MAQVHDFVVLNKETYTYKDYMNVINIVPYDVSIHDDLILYFYDFLQWIPAYNPSMQIRHMGLNLYGVTAIDIDGATQAYDLFVRIVDIFKLSPETLKLNGGCTYQLADDEDPFSESKECQIVRNSLKQEKLTYQRDEIVEQFEKLVECFKKVIDSNGQLYVMHFEI